MYNFQEHHRSQEKEIQRASQLSQNELFNSSDEVADVELPNLISKLKSDDHSSQQSSGSSSSGNGSIKSGAGSPRQQNVGHSTTKSEPIRKDSEGSQQRSSGEADTTNIRLKLGGFSGRSSRYLFLFFIS